MTEVVFPGGGRSLTSLADSRPETLFLVLTDVVGSTQLAASLGDYDNAALWDAHDQVARALLSRWNGREVERTDGILAVFRDQNAALAFARGYLSGLRRLQPPLEARVGIHRGPLVLRHNRAEDIRRGAKALEADGLALSIAARVNALAVGGQVLLTDAAVGQQLDAVSQGFWHLKGTPEPMELFALAYEAHPSTPLKDGEKAYRVVKDGKHWVPVHAIPKTLPAEWDGFFGREEALNRVTAHLSGDVRLLTLTGIGGVGKTRLACHYAWTALAAYPGGSWFCDLTEARTKDDVVRLVAAALAVPIGARDAAEQVGHAIEGRGRCLVLVDNFEQVVATAGETVARWLAMAPEARFLITSRERLGVPGELVCPLDLLAEDDALGLFKARADAAKPGFLQESTEQEEDIRALVRRLDLLPLAIELAAPRIRVMSPRMLLDRLSLRLNALSPHERRSARSANLRANIDWSWELLADPGRRALAELSVFEGGFTLSAGEAVVGVEDGLELIQTLVDRSLVRRVEEDRFDLLPLVKEYANEKLNQLGLRLETEERHGRYFAAAHRERTPRAQVAAVRELDNVVAACRHAIRRADAEVALTTLKAAWAVTERQGPASLAAELAAEVGDLPGLHPGLRDRLGAEALLASGSYLEGQRELRLSLTRLGFAEPRTLPGLIFRIISKTLKQAWRRRTGKTGAPASSSVEVLMAATRAYQRLVETYWFMNRPDRMLGAALSAVDICEPVGATPDLARAYGTLALAASGLRFDDTADRYAALALATAEGSEAPLSEAYVRFLACVYRVGHGRFDEVEADLDIAIPMLERAQDFRILGDANAVRGLVHLYRGRFAMALEQFERVIRAGQRRGNDQHVVWGRLGAGEANLRLAEPKRARREVLAAFKTLERFPSVAEIARARGLLAHIELALGRGDAADEACERALRELKALGAPTAHYLLESYASVVEVQLALGLAPRRALRLMRRYAQTFPVGEPRLAWLESEVLKRRGRTAAAQHRAAEGLRAARALGMAFDAARLTDAASAGRIREPRSLEAPAEG